MVAAATVPTRTRRAGRREGRGSRGVGPSCSIARPQPRETGRGEEEVARSVSGTMQGGRKREGWERNSRLEAALWPGGGSVNHSPLSRYVTNSTSAISVTWPDKISLSRPGEAEASISLSGRSQSFFFEMKFNIFLIQGFASLDQKVLLFVSSKRSSMEGKI